MWFFYTQWALTSQQKMLVDDVICMDPTPPDAYEMLRSLVGSEMCIRDSLCIPSQYSLCV